MADNNKNDIMRIAAPAVTMTGRMPSDVTWRFTPLDVKKDILMVIAPVFGDLTVDDVGLFLDESGNRCGAMVKIPKDSGHITDKTSKDLLVRNPIFSYSKELKELMEKYCPKNAQKLIQDVDKRYFDIAIDLEKVYKVVLDTNGEYAKKQCGNEHAYKTELSVVTLRDRNDPKRLKMIEVTKSGKSVFKKEPRPTKSYNF